MNFGTEAAQQLYNFLVIAAMYSIVAIGFSLYFGTTNLINFAHGDLCALGAFLLLGTLRVLGDGSDHVSWRIFSLATFISIGTCVLFGLFSERFIFRAVRSRAPLKGLILSIALSMLIRESILHFYPNGGNPQPFPDPFDQEHFSLGTVNVSKIQIFLLTLSALMMSCFYWFARKTHIGRTLRAISQDAEAAIMMGIPVNKSIGWAFAVGAVFASIAGVMNGALYGSVRYDMGYHLGIRGFVAAVIGGLENPQGALVGGLILALLEVSVVALVPGGSSYRDIVAFALLVGVLLFKPSGILSVNTETRR